MSDSELSVVTFPNRIPVLDSHGAIIVNGGMVLCAVPFSRDFAWTMKEQLTEKEFSAARYFYTAEAFD